MASTALAAAAEAATTTGRSVAQIMKKRPTGMPISRKTGIVVSAGLAQNTVKVQVGGEEWNKKVKKVWLPWPPAISIHIRHD